MYVSQTQKYIDNKNTFHNIWKFYIIFHTFFLLYTYIK